VNVYPFDGHHPKLHPSAFIAPGASVIGDVELGPDVSIWHGAAHWRR
jgi:gamma-carbonic anhydrase